MSQHDFDIANQTFPSFRSDLNDALQAAATISAGATAPTTPYAYQLWFDTSTNTYKARNAANSAWISLFGTDLTNGGINFGDNDKAIFGAGSDLQIYHNGTSASYITDQGTGNLVLGGDSAIILQNAAHNANMLDAYNGGRVGLYHAGNLKLATTATGVDVTGTVTADGLTVDGTGGQITTDNNGFITSKQSLDVATAGGRFIGKSNRGELGQIAIEQTATGADGGYIRFNTSPSGSTSPTQRMQITEAGNVGISKTAFGSISTDGFWWENGASKYLALSGTGTSPIYLNRNGSDGGIVNFYKSGTNVGLIGVGSGSGNPIYIGSGATGLDFEDANDAIRPINASNGNGRDNSIDLGRPDVRFDDIYATNGTIQTSDANEKQQIAALTDAEITAAKTISTLFKTFKWNSAVEGKGDAARTHAGVIAQDVEAAMTAAGLDAGDYAFFISSTWWETQTDVPAVDAVDAVYEGVVIPAVLDDDGNEVEAERTEQRTVTEAVEAVAAYTRTDTYDTAEEAPAGATERNRKGIRYPELLAFVGAATEQRLANIETRLAALEAS